MKKYHRGAGFIILVMALVFSLSSLRTGIIHASNPSSAPAACNDMPDAEARTLTVAFRQFPAYVPLMHMAVTRGFWLIISMKSQNTTTGIMNT